MRHMLQSIGIAIAVFALLAAPSNAQGIQDSGDTCATLIIPLVEQAGLFPGTSAPAVGCRANDDRSWFMPTISEAFDNALLARLSPESRSVLDALDHMSIDPAFDSSLRFDRHDMTVLVPGVRGVVDTIDVADTALGVAPEWMHNVQSSYTGSVETFLTRTAGTEAELVLYIQWFMARRDAVLSTITLQMNPMAATAFQANWGYQQFPWPWQLADPAAIVAHTGQTLLGPAASGTSSDPTEASNTDATQVTNGVPRFSPEQLSVVRGGSAGITVSLPPTTSEGGFTLNITLPAGVNLLTVPQCAPFATCQSAFVQMDVGENQDGAIVVQISGVLNQGGTPTGFSLMIGISEQVAAGQTLLVTAEVSFGSHSAPAGSGGQSALNITVSDPAAQSQTNSAGVTTEE